jgi:hypothetical protein
VVSQRRSLFIYLRHSFHRAAFDLLLAFRNVVRCTKQRLYPSGPSTEGQDRSLHIARRTRTTAMTTESPRRKARPSPIQVPLSPSRASGIERPIATSTGIISARRKLSLDPAPLTGAPGIIGSEARRKRNSNSHLPPPKSAAANFAQQRGISTVTVRTTLPLSPHTGNDASPSPKTGSSHAVSAVSAKSTEERGLGSPLKTSGLRTSRTVEVDYLRNEMEKAMRMAGAETTEPDAEVRKDSE